MFKRSKKYLFTFFYRTGISSPVNFEIVLDVSLDEQGTQMTQLTRLMGKIPKLFNNKVNRDQIKVSLHGYGADKLKPSLRDTISQQITPFELGQTETRFGPLLEKILEKSPPRNAEDKDDVDSVMVLFLSGTLYKTPSEAEMVIRSATRLSKEKGYKLIVVSTSPNVNEKETVDIFEKEGANIINVGQPNLLPSILPSLERSIADAAITGKLFFNIIAFMTWFIRKVFFFISFF